MDLHESIDDLPPHVEFTGQKMIELKIRLKTFVRTLLAEGELRNKKSTRALDIDAIRRRYTAEQLVSDTAQHIAGMIVAVCEAEDALLDATMANYFRKSLFAVMQAELELLFAKSRLVGNDTFFNGAKDYLDCTIRQAIVEAHLRQKSTLETLQSVEEQIAKDQFHCALRTHCILQIMFHAPGTEEIEQAPAIQEPEQQEIAENSPPAAAPTETLLERLSTWFGWRR